MNERRFIDAAFWLVLAAAVALRLLRLDTGLWYDEVVTLVEFVRLPAHEIVTTYTTLNNHVLYSLLGHVSVGVFGESAWALRLPAALFGIASIWLLWRLAIELTERREALLATALVAASYHHIWFSQNARGYTGLLCFTLLGTALFLRATRDGSARLWLGYGVVAALALYTHLSAVFVFASHGLVWLAMWTAGALGRTRGHDRRLGPGAALGFLLGALLLLLAYAPLIPGLLEILRTPNPAAPVAEWRSPLWTLLEMVNGLPLGPFPWVVVGLGAVVGGVGCLSYLRRDPCALALMLLPPILTLAGLIVLSRNIWPRYFLVSLGFVALIGVRGLFTLAAVAVRMLGRPDRGWDGRRLATGAAVLGIALSSATLPALYRLPKQDYVGARNYVRGLMSSADRVVTIGLASVPYSIYFAPEWTVIESAEELDDARATAEHTWLVYSFSTHLHSRYPEVVERMQSDFERVARFPGTLGDGTIYVLRSRDSQGSPE